MGDPWYRGVRRRGHRASMPGSDEAVPVGRCKPRAAAGIYGRIGAPADRISTPPNPHPDTERGKCGCHRAKGHLGQAPVGVVTCCSQ